MKENQANELVIKNLPLVKKCIKDMFKTGSLYYRCEEEFESIYFEALLGLIKGSKKYNSDVATEGTYFYTCIRNGILNYIHYSSMEKRKLDQTVKFSLDNFMCEDDASSGKIEEFIKDQRVNIEKEIENKILLEEILKDVRKTRGGKINLKIFKMKYGLDEYEPMSMQEIADVFNCSKQNIYRRLCSVKKKLQKKYK